MAAGETADPRRFSALADKIVYRDVFRRMPLLADSALKAYFQTVVDTKNIVMLLRSKALGWDLSRFGEMFLSGGLIPYRAVSYTHLHMTAKQPKASTSGMIMTAVVETYAILALLAGLLLIWNIPF